MIKTTVDIQRRNLLLSGCLIIGCTLAPKRINGALAVAEKVAKGGIEKALNAFVVVAPDDSVTVLCKHIEFGQGPYTGLATLVADEMDADWKQIRVESAPADDALYANTLFGVQLTGGSSSIANSFTQMREAGATARSMLLTAAAEHWSVPVSELQIVNGRIQHKASGKESGFGKFVARASQLKAPEKVTLKTPAQFKLIGKSLPKVDSLSKSNGTAKFTLDIDAENMLIATVAHPTQFGATVKSFNPSAAKAVPGVVDVKQVPQGVAVIAENSYAALKGRAALQIEWNTDSAEKRSSEQLIEHYRSLLDKKGLVATDNGNVDKILTSPGIKILEAEFVFPFLAHAPMEPLDAVLMRNRQDNIDCYAGSQFPGADKKAIADVCGVDPLNVNVHVQLAGGSFGRRAQFNSPFMREAAEVFKASGMQRPVKFFWTREDDITGGFYRPLYVHRIKAAIDGNKQIVAWDQMVVGQSIMGSTDKVDHASVEGASDMPYAIPNLRLISHNTNQVGVPPLWWRSVGHSHTAFTVEAFIDELLQQAEADPIEGRLALLKNHPRESGVLRKVANMVDAAGATPKGRARGVAVHKSFNSYVAEVAEVSQRADGTPQVHRVWVAVDCGMAVNPNVIEAQMEGGIGYGLGAVLFNEITLGENGAVQQSNFHNYRSLRINEMPKVEVAIIDSKEDPTGVGEPGLPPIGPAVANAWRRLTGAAVRRLPMVKAG